MAEQDRAVPYHMRESEGQPIPADANSDELPPGYEENTDLVNIDQLTNRIDYSQFISSGKGLASIAKLTDDGRISISLNLKRALPDLPQDHALDVNEVGVDKQNWREYPSLNIVVMIVGSRGDVQPYIALGKRLLIDGHRVRIATHETFRAFVTDAGLEFFAIGGDPQDLMSYMVKNPGLIPGMTTLMNGDIGRKLKMLSEMMNGCWNACHATCPKTGRTFAADSIISNPPAFAHIHCAEALGIPVLLSFTMPWSPTTAFPHPLVNIKESNAENGLTNYLSYAVTEILTWQGMGGIVNKFRTKTLGLSPLSLRSGPNLADTLKIPWTYCMSAALVPKPKDWKQHIDVVGFYFLDLGTNFAPPDDLAHFLAAGDAPVYIGFGSVVVEDATAMTETIFKATEKAGVRALVSAGWGGLGGVSVPPNIFILGNIPHDWLFDKGRVKGVVHHGGAGTTAAGLSKGLPTAIVPFFGDQGFWGSMVHKAGAGPAPIPHKQLNVDNLTEAIKFIVSPPAQSAAKKMAEQIRSEDGVKQGVESYYRHLPLKNMRCDIDPSRAAVWWSTEYCLRLSGFAAQVLMDAKKLKLDELDPHRAVEFDTRKEHTDPLTGTASGIFWTVTHYYAGIAQIFYSPIKGVINTTTAIPVGVMKIVSSLHEGFENLPKLYGSDVRKRKKVTGFKSGITEGGKGLFYGYYDGITGLVREPMQGAKKEGFIGAIKGSARSFVNATMRPAAGIVGLVVHPLNGVWKTAQSSIARAQQQNFQYSTRVSDGVAAVKASSPQQRQGILKKFEELKMETDARQKKYAEAAEREMKMWSDQAAKSRDNDEGPESGSSSVPQQTPSRGDSTAMSSTTLETPSETVPEPAKPQAQPSGLSQEDLDRAYERELDMAIQLSIAEQKGYERGVAQQFHQ